MHYSSLKPPYKSIRSFAQSSEDTIITIYNVVAVRKKKK